MKQQLMTLLLGAASVFCSCETQMEQHVKSELRAPAYPLVSIDPYTSAWSFTDNLYDGSVKHWSGKDFPFGCGRGSQGGGQKAQADPKDDAETKETVHPGAACRRQGGTEKEAPGAGKIKRNGGMRNVFHRGRRKPDLSVSQHRPPQDGGKSPGSFAGHGQGNGGAGLPDRR